MGYRDGDAVWRIPRGDHRSRPGSQLAAKHVYPVTGGPGVGDFLSAAWELLSTCFPRCDFYGSGTTPAFPVGRYLPSPAISPCGDLAAPLREYLQRRWTDAYGLEAKAAAVSTPAMGQNGLAYVGLEKRYLAAYDQNGREKWKQKWISQPVSVAIGRATTRDPVNSHCLSIGESGRVQHSSEQQRFRDRLFVLLGDGAGRCGPHPLDRPRRLDHGVPERAGR
ncbi:MAG: hypothetical protein M3376_08355 [Actinomycetota bacterium]|nr:hypothetical protein [Actinomycetota bacterium]